MVDLVSISNLRMCMFVGACPSCCADWNPHLPKDPVVIFELKILVFEVSFENPKRDAWKLETSVPVIGVALKYTPNCVLSVLGEVTSFEPKAISNSNLLGREYGSSIGNKAKPPLDGPIKLVESPRVNSGNERPVEPVDNPLKALPVVLPM